MVISRALDLIFSSIAFQESRIPLNYIPQRRDYYVRHSSFSHSGVLRSNVHGFKTLRKMMISTKSMIPCLSFLTGPYLRSGMGTSTRWGCIFHEEAYEVKAYVVPPQKQCTFNCLRSKGTGTNRNIIEQT